MKEGTARQDTENTSHSAQQHNTRRPHPTHGCQGDARKVHAVSKRPTFRQHEDSGTGADGMRKHNRHHNGILHVRTNVSVLGHSLVQLPIQPFVSKGRKLRHKNRKQAHESQHKDNQQRATGGSSGRKVSVSETPQRVSAQGQRSACLPTSWTMSAYAPHNRQHNTYPMLSAIDSGKRAASTQQHGKHPYRQTSSEDSSAQPAQIYETTRRTAPLSPHSPDHNIAYRMPYLDRLDGGPK